MSEKMNSELLSMARRLVSLLEDPHPGLHTWHLAVASRLDDLVAFRLNAPEEPPRYRGADLTGRAPTLYGVSLALPAGEFEAALATALAKLA